MKQPSAEWLKLWAEKRSLLTCAVDLDAYFTLAEMAGKKLDRIAIGKVSFPTGRVIVRDPFVYLSPECEPYFLPVPPGEYETELAVIVADDENEARYAALRVKIFAAEAVRYEEALTGAEDLANLKEDEYFGFNVGAGLVCICDTGTKEAFLSFVKDWEKEKDGKKEAAENVYDGYFAPLLDESYKNQPQYQRSNGDWLNWRIPGTAYHVPICQSGFGAGAYPVYYGFDAGGNICSLVVQFIDIGLAYGGRNNQH